MSSETVTISVRKIRVPCHLGCIDEERARKQIVTLDLDLEVLQRGAERNDELSDTLNYMEVIALIERECSERSWKLIEKMTNDLGLEILENFPNALSVSISICKHIIPNAEGVSVRRVLSRNG